ncbi:hypothetical protein CDAR_57191 [Caerostris darwini]|uniref:Uncharacterized protein n=1 Tax=Caerostris darwini TaxID=1538125 RepID=A0AAV4WCU9_9ARAC|nr:hypothetical protein CDAR_57191 [Caerostris darwini]
MVGDAVVDGCVDCRKFSCEYSGMITQSEYLVGSLDVILKDNICSSNLIVHSRPVREDQCTGNFLIKDISCDALFIPWRYEAYEERECLGSDDQTLCGEVLDLVLKKVEFL